ncbi:MAG: ABC transporter substrate-binding protein [Spirochaetota bacterium]
MNKNEIALIILFSLSLAGPLTLFGTSVEYAEGFSVEQRSNYTLLHVHPPGEASELEVSYVLIPREREDISEIKQEIGPDSHLQIVRTPVQRLIPLSTTFLPPLEWLDAEETLVAVDNPKHIYSRSLRRRMREQDLPQVGNGPTLDMEMVVRLQPAVVMANVTQGAWNVVPKLRQADVPVILNSDYLEPTPLGRAEWIKFIGLLLGRGEEAEERFNAVAESYRKLQRLVDRNLQSEDARPQVVLNRPMNGRWVVPGGNGYMARFIEDAGGAYVWAEAEQSSSLVLDVEEVFVRALRADFWLQQYGISSMQELLNADQRLNRIRAVTKGNVINNDARMSSTDSNDFFESGPYQPHLILSDLISLFHPQLLPNHSLYYYRHVE